MITESHVEQMKRRLKIFHDAEDDHIQNLLEQSYEDLSRRCNFHDMDDSLAKELVFERTRYAYNDSLEFFNKNFLSQIMTLSLLNMDVIDDDTSI